MKILLALLIAMAIGSVSISCVQMPTERAAIVDTRPQISFRVHGDAVSMRIFIDGLDMGSVSNYLDGGTEGGGRALRILPGSHILRIESGGVMIHEEKLYVGDGVSKVIQIP
jgi:hypothetical protein